MLRPATPLTVLFFVAFILLLLSTISTPIIKAIPLATFNGVNFGVFGYCKASGCISEQIGYSVDSKSLLGNSDGSDFSLPSSARSDLSSILVVHPVAALLTLICLILAAASHLHSPSHSPRYLLALIIFSIPTLLISLLAFLVDILLFVPHVAWGGWIVLAATILILASTIVTCAMRRTLVSRKARKKRIAENAEMNGENFYARQAPPPVMMMERAESPPPLPSEPSMSGGLNSDKLPKYATFESKSQPEEDMIPLNQRTPSNKTLPSMPSSRGGYSDESFNRYGGPGRGASGGTRGGRGGFSGGRDEYGNPLPPSNAFGPMPPAGMRRDQSEPPRIRHQYSDEMMNSRAAGRGGFPPRGGYGRGGYGRGGMPNGPMIGGAGASMMANDWRQGHGRPPPGYGNGYPPPGGRPGQYEGPGPAGYGRSPSAPGYGRRPSPGPPSAPGAYGRRPPPGYPSMPGNYGRGPPRGPPSDPGGYARGPSRGPPSDPGSYVRGPSRGPPSDPGGYNRGPPQPMLPGGYGYAIGDPAQGPPIQQYRDEPPPPLPMNPYPGNPEEIGQAVEMDARTGAASPALKSSNYPPPMQLRDSDSDVQGFVGLQQRQQHRESPRSLTSDYSNQEPYIPPRAAWTGVTRGVTPPPNTTALDPIELPSQQTLTKHKPRSSSLNQTLAQDGHRRNKSSADNYYEDVDPRFASTSPRPDTGFQTQHTQSSNTMPASLMPGLATVDSTKHLPVHPTVGKIDPSSSSESLHDGQMSPAASENSVMTSISQRGVNPNWRPPSESNHRSGQPNLDVPGRRPVQPQQQREMLLNSNPDFELPGRAPLITGQQGQAF